MSAEAAEKLPAADSPHIVATARQWELAQKSRKRRRIINGKTETYDARPLPDLATTLAAERIAERDKRLADDAELIASAKPGQFIRDHGVFIGRWTATFKTEGQAPLTETFNAFAAPQDIVDKNGNNTFTFIAAAEAVASLKDWHSYNGEKISSEQELFEALKNHTYNGGWFIPPSELLAGKDMNGNDVQPDNLLAQKDKRDFKGTFNTQADGTICRPGAYWSCTPTGVNYSIRRGVNLSTSEALWYFKNAITLSCRPVRLERVMPPPAQL